MVTPFTVYGWLYPWLPVGEAKLQVVELGVQEQEETALLPSESVTIMEKLKLPAAVGVPVMTPVDVFRVKPAGSVPEAME
jgi:hypothetical protein